MIIAGLKKSLLSEGASKPNKLPSLSGECSCGGDKSIVHVFL